MKKYFKIELFYLQLDKKKLKKTNNKQKIIW